MVSAGCFFVFLCLACAHAARLQTDSDHNIETQEQSNFGRSCETLHSRFRSRSNNLQKFVNSYTASDDMSLAASARATMKVTAVLRTLRRSSDCPWVVDGNSDDFEAVGKVVRKVLANNPCAPAALAELQLLDTDGQEGTAPLARAMAILMSDTCETPQGEESDESNELVQDEDIVETEELVQDVLEEMLESKDASSSLVEQSDMQRAHSWAYVGKLTGALMLGVLVLLGCGVALAYLGVFLGLFLSLVLAFVVADAGPILHYNGVRIVGNRMARMSLFAASGVLAVGGAVHCGQGFFEALNASSLLLDQ